MPALSHTDITSCTSNKLVGLCSKLEKSKALGMAVAEPLQLAPKPAVTVEGKESETMAHMMICRDVSA
jgi:hypothetical protein